MLNVLSLTQSIQSDNKSGAQTTDIAQQRFYSGNEKRKKMDMTERSCDRQTETDMTVTGRALRPHKEDSDKAKFRPLFHSTLRLCQGFNLDIT